MTDQLAPIEWRQASGWTMEEKVKDITEIVSAQKKKRELWAVYFSRVNKRHRKT